MVYIICNNIIKFHAQSRKLIIQLTYSLQLDIELFKIE